MGLCSYLPIIGDLSKPHLYGSVGIIVGGTLGILWGLFWPTKERAIFGRAPHGRFAGAMYGFIGMLAGLIVAWLVRLGCGG
jgi:hypothetical protein